MQPSSLFGTVRARDVGVILASWLNASPAPFTEILAEHARSPVQLDVTGRGTRQLTRDEPGRLGAPPEMACHWRRGFLSVDGMMAARVTLMWLRPRLWKAAFLAGQDPDKICAALEAGEQPAGAVLAPIGMQRTDRRAGASQLIEEVTGQPAACISSAVLTAQGQHIGIAEEFITKAFAEQMVRRHSRSAHVGRLGLEPRTR